MNLIAKMLSCMTLGRWLWRLCVADVYKVLKPFEADFPMIRHSARLNYLVEHGYLMALAWSEFYKGKN